MQINLIRIRTNKIGEIPLTYVNYTNVLLFTNVKSCTIMKILKAINLIIFRSLSMIENEYKTKKELGIKGNKNITINSVDMLKLDNFRHFKDKTISLGKNITVIFGENGTSKSTLMGLIAHPFRTNVKDISGNKMETKFSDVFKLSLEHDKNYLYHLYFNIKDDKKLSIPVDIKRRENEKRFRIIPSGSSGGDGFFSLPTVYSSLSRLYPLVKTKTKDDSKEENKIHYNDNDRKFIASAYKKILLSEDFNEISPIEGSEKNDKDYSKISKTSIGPSNTYYDKTSISSGEDNLGSLINTMISFNRITKDDHSLTGIWAIDEFESSLHPSVQLNLFNFILDWSKKHRVQIILTTHSLYLLQNIFSFNDELDKGNIVINEIENLWNSPESLDIITNPSYSATYKQLTLEDRKENQRSNIIDNIPINILCEDDVAANFLKQIFKRKRSNKEIFNRVNYQFNMTENINKNTSFISLKKLAKDFTQVVKDANGIIIADADVDNDDKISFDRYFIIPSLFKLPIEAELFGWILSLDNNDSFFSERIKTPKKIFLHNAVEKESRLPLKFDTFKEFAKSHKNNQAKKTIIPFKNWYNSLTKKRQNKIIVSYINAPNNLNLFMQFREKIISCVKKIYSENGLKI